MKLYTPKEISKMLSINYRKVLDMIALGEIKAYRIGKMFRISDLFLKEYLDSVEVKSFWKK